MAMTERDRVLEAYRNCISEPKCKDCPWTECENIGNSTIEIPRDLALAVMRELMAQEPRVMTLEEVKESKGADMYLEICTRTDEIPYITAATLDGVGIKGVTFYCSNFDFVAYNRRLYGWRCWTARPTDEQRKAVKWDD